MVKGMGIGSSTGILSASGLPCHRHERGARAERDGMGYCSLPSAIGSRPDWRLLRVPQTAANMRAISHLALWDDDEF